ncbi:XrtA/PEP-CTERM system TPR-repeat protein PrsT [Massilia sp. BSC265]|uniref:XrtA/PEP-CTERM system TPR-repeat protein PrsT n=1 Tax=Massilia sp. BSC265 TaxID=1549812 RepID=UPI0004E8D923|nr:XrtA/PEP-CTERM system TPR-repeat protein PrsT [Massilia sp. BSC265]KFI05124.1 hypothetical protein JN27_21880 [Massilia sp. BSC265]
MPRHLIKHTLTAALVTAALGTGLAACNQTKPTATLLAEAKAYQEKGDRKAAMIQLKNAVANTPEDAEARFQLGALHLDSGDAVSAEKELRKALSLGISADRALPLLGRALQTQGQPAKILEEITAEKAKASAELLALRGDALLMSQKPDEAKQAFEQALQVKATSGEALTGLARHALYRNDIEAAERFANEAVGKDPKNPDAWLFQANLLRSLNKPEQAMTAFTRVTELRPHDRIAHVEKAYIQISQGKFEEARKNIKAAQDNAPGNLLATYAQALLDFTQGKNALAQESVQKVLKNAPNHMPSILLAGAIELNLGATQQAEQHLRKYLETNSDNLYARKLLAQAQLKNAQPQDAAATLAPALESGANDPQLLALAGQSYLQARDFDRATAYFEKASSIAPKVAALHTSLGLSRLGQGEKDKAINDLEKGAALDPGSLQGGMTLVQAELNLKRHDKALAAAQRLVKQHPDNAQAHGILGAVHFAKGDVPEARVSLEKALALQPTYFAAVSSLAQLDLREKKPAEAKARFTALLAKDPKHIGAMNALAELALLEKKPAEATSWLEKASTSNPEAVAPALQLGTHYLRIKENQKALTLARKTQTANPTHPDVLDLLGQAQLANNDASGALDSYSRLTNVLPKSAMAQYRMAAAYMALKNETEAANHLKRAVALDPDFLPAHLAQIDLATRGNRPELVLANARALQAREAHRAIGYVIEADLLSAQGKATQALPLYEKAFAEKQDAKILINIHRAMLQSGKEAQADSRIANWMKTHPDDVAMALYVAERSLAKGQYKQAASQFEAATRVAPGNAIALNNLAWTYQQLKDPRALETAEAAYRISGDNPAVLDTLGMILAERGDLKRGLPMLQKAVSLAPHSGDLRLHLAEVLAKSGDKAAARKELETIVAKSNGPGAARAKTLLEQL